MIFLMIGRALNKSLVNGYINKYFNKIMNIIENNKYEFVFLISGQSLSLSEKMIKTIKDCQSQARFVLYQWDSQTNFPYIKEVQKYFDKVYSFDKSDVLSTQGLKFLPLFYSRNYEKIGNENKTDYKYDFCFVGTAHPKKYKFIKMMSEQLKSVYPNQYIYFYFPSKIVFFYRKIHDIELRKSRMKEFHFDPLKGIDMERVYKNTRCVLDSAQAGQMGLTIRVVEALGAKKKMITTNEDVKNYDFYRPENIYIYNGTIDLNNVFFSNPYVDIDPVTYKKYSLESWLKEIIEN